MNFYKSIPDTVHRFSKPHAGRKLKILFRPTL